MQQDLSKDENEREDLYIKRSKLITKIYNLDNIEEANKIEKQIVDNEISKDDSSRMFKELKDH